MTSLWEQLWKQFIDSIFVATCSGVASAFIALVFGLMMPILPDWIAVPAFFIGLMIAAIGLTILTVVMIPAFFIGLMIAAIGLTILTVVMIVETILL